MIKSTDLINLFQQAYADKWGYIWGTSGETWTQAKQNKAASEREQTAKWGSKWIGHRVSDCSGLFYWAFKQLGGSIFHGSNTIWNKYCSNQGKLVNGKRSDGQELKPGTAVFTYKAAENNRSHIGLYIGNGKVIEAKGTYYGVVQSSVTNTSWNEWGELKGVSYETSSEEPTPVTPVIPDIPDKPTLRKGATGMFVQEAQNLLIRAGYSCGNKGADGIFGKDTLAAVKLFQKDWGLDVDGVIGPKTWAMLEKSPSRTLYSVTIDNLTENEVEKLKKEYTSITVNKA